MRPIRLFLLTAALALAPLAHAQQPAQAAKPHDLEDFIREDKFRELAVSPDGTYIAAAVPIEDKTVLVVMKRGEKKPVSRIDVGGSRTHVYGITWVGKDRLIYSMAKRDQLIENPIFTPVMWSINADGSRPVGLTSNRDNNAYFGGRAGGKGAREDIALTVLDPLPDDENAAIVQVYRWDIFHTVERINPNTASRVRITQAPVRNARFSLDNKGEPRFSWGFDTDRVTKLYQRNPADDKWALINNEEVSGVNFYPIGYSADNSVAYMQVEHRSGPDSVEAFDLASGKRMPLHRDGLADPTGFINAIGKRHLIGVYYAGATPRYVYFDPDSAEAKAHRALQKAFPGQIVGTGSRVTAANEVLIYARADREPGTYFMMNLDTRNVVPLMYAAEWLDPMRLNATRDVVIEARDGRKLPGLLTLPNGGNGKNLPLIVHPHGGPFAVHDEWGYDTGVQVLASHGYAVLQVNFRGSSGYGREHQIAGYKQWGLKMQDDLTDATRWAISEGIADPKRICLYGASYGGYASLMGVAKEPDLYKCVAGQVGIYDLGRVKSEDSLGNDYNRDFFDDSMNDGDLSPVSPNRIASRIKVPVFLSAGHEDETAPVEHTEMMEVALKKAGVPVETLYFKTEGHGIYKMENRRAYYAKLLAFFQRHLGGREPVVAAATAQK